jgi:hypothetical protein
MFLMCCCSGSGDGWDKPEIYFSLLKMLRSFRVAYVADNRFIAAIRRSVGAVIFLADADSIF